VIGRLRGRVTNEEPLGSVTLDVGGVGYDLVIPLGALGRAPATEDGEITLSVHTLVRQDVLELFGFASELERRVFRLLIGVPNVGPRTAIAVLSALAVTDLSRAVQENDVARLTKVPGIGKKTAERLVLELKGKFPVPTDETRGVPRRDEDRLVGALTNMGYRAAEAEAAVKAVSDRLGTAPLSDVLREALGRLAPRG